MASSARSNSSRSLSRSSHCLSRSSRSFSSSPSSAVLPVSALATSALATSWLASESVLARSCAAAARSSASSRATASACSCRSSSRLCARWAWRSRRRAASKPLVAAWSVSHWPCSASQCFVREVTRHRRRVLSSSVVSFRSCSFSSLSFLVSARRLRSSLSCILMRSLKCSATSSASPALALAPTLPAPSEEAASAPLGALPCESQICTMTSWTLWKCRAAKAEKPAS
mmetsp:Transcript_28920/g.86034  ORF Transcript_28920/g.86034 Transcript_28920/m.86034 type:complete len:229 (+) Transcript_28920:801-1487(+)